MYPRRPLNERGIALPLVLFVMVILGVIIAGSFYVGRLEQKTGDNTIATAQAFGAAEAGIDSVLGTWNTATYNAMATSSELTLPTENLGGNNSVTPVLRRLTNTTFLLRAEGRHLSPSGVILGRRTVGQYLRLNTPAINMNAAITVQGGITVSGSSEVSGRDSVPTSMTGTCPPPGPTVPGIRDSSGAVTTSGSCSGASCITGNPQILTDPTVTSATFTTFGNVTFAQLAAAANQTLSGTINGIGPVISGGACSTGVLSNWGDPMNPASACGNYFPVLYAPGDVRLTGGQGQGILLVAGDLDISGGVEFYGPVIVLGTVRSTGTGGHFFGGLMAANANFSTTLLSGNSVVDYSSCTIQRALNGISTAVPFGQRSWSQLY